MRKLACVARALFGERERWLRRPEFNAAVVKAIAAPEVQERLRQVGSEPVSGPPEKLAQRVKTDLVKFAEIVRIAGARAD